MELIRSASPYWRITWSKKITFSDAIEQVALPYNLQIKVQSINVKMSVVTKMPEATITFKSLTLTESENTIFHNDTVFNIWLGWYDMLGVSAEAYLVATGNAKKLDITYEKSGLSATLTLSCVGDAYLKRPYATGYDGSELRRLSLKEVLTRTVHLGGLDCLFRGDSWVRLLQRNEEMRDDFWSKVDEADKQAIDSQNPLERYVYRKFEEYEPYFAPWADFFALPKDVTGNFRITPNKTKLQNSPWGLLGYLSAIYKVEFYVGGKFIVFDTLSKPGETEAVEPQRYFSYRGGTSKSVSESMKDMFSEAISNTFNILKEDTYEGFFITASDATVAKQNAAIKNPPNKPAEVKKVESEEVYNIVTVNDDMSKVINTEGWNKAYDRASQNAEMIKNKKLATVNAEDAPTNKLVFTGTDATTIKYFLEASVNEKNIGQVGRITGAVGSPDVALYTYFYFEGRLEDTSYYKIKEIEHNFSVGGGFKTSFTGTMVLTPYTKEYIEIVEKKKKEIAKAQETYYIRVMGGRMGSSLKPSAMRRVGTDMLALYAPVSSEYYTKGVYMPGVDFDLIQCTKAEYEKALQVEKETIRKKHPNVCDPVKGSELCTAEKLWVREHPFFMENYVHSVTGTVYGWTEWKKRWADYAEEVRKNGGIQ